MSIKPQAHKTLLHLDSSPLETSVSRELTREFTNSWEQAHPGGQVLYRDLAAQPPELIDAQWIGAAYTDENARTEKQRRTLASSDELISELEQADEYVIGVAMHNFSIPAVLRLWIDEVVRRGKTFSYGADGPQGLLQGKKATIVVASGGVYSSGSPAASMDHVEPYLRTVLGFIGIREVRFIWAGGTSKLMTGAVERGSYLKPLLQEVRAAAI